MTEFTFLLRGRNFATSPAESQQTLERWVAWFKDLGDQGQLEDPGHPLAVEGRFSVGRRLPPIRNLSENNCPARRGSNVNMSKPAKPPRIAG
jgi:hypothetical protein